MPDKEKGTTVQSVSRALDILNYFENEEELGISELAGYMGLSKSSVYGLVNTLTAYGYLQQSENKRYRLGIRLFELGNIMHQRIDQRAEAKLLCAQLSERLETTVHLAMHSGGDVIYIDKVNDPRSIISYSQVGKRAPMYCTAVGKAMMAHLPESYREQFVYSREMRTPTGLTRLTCKTLEEELETIRRRGYATDIEELEKGICCIAAPVFNSYQEPQMAISASFLTGRFLAMDTDEVAQQVMYFAGQISRKLGGKAL